MFDVVDAATRLRMMSGVRQNKEELKFFLLDA
jgi:hypothetical protein